MSDFHSKIQAQGVVPVLVIDELDQATPLATALKTGGLKIIEVTMRTPVAAEAIKTMTKIPGILIGAGTVLNAEQCRIAIDAGSQFIVSPGLDKGVVDAAQDAGLPVFPGCVTASEVQHAWNLGLRAVKFFPAGIAGGPMALKALASVFQDMKFMPTGGVNADNLAEYLSLDAVIACGGSWIAPNNLVREEKYDEISSLAASAIALARSTRT